MKSRSRLHLAGCTGWGRGIQLTQARGSSESTSAIAIMAMKAPMHTWLCKLNAINRNCMGCNKHIASRMLQQPSHAASSNMQPLVFSPLRPAQRPPAEQTHPQLSNLSWGAEVGVSTPKNQENGVLAPMPHLATPWHVWLWVPPLGKGSSKCPTALGQCWK